LNQPSIPYPKADAADEYKRINSLCPRQFLDELHDVLPLLQELVVEAPVEPDEGDEEGDDLVAAQLPEFLKRNFSLLGADGLACAQELCPVGDELGLQLAH
jgi:hypothetical protein